MMSVSNWGKISQLVWAKKNLYVITWTYYRELLIVQSGIFQKFHISKLNMLIVFVLHVFSPKYKKKTNKFMKMMQI